jgi:hypothetical protein
MSPGFLAGMNMGDDSPLDTITVYTAFVYRNIHT